ncbi:MAG: hypothetical protein JST35_04260 [Armatimonadetes bacterium]|jgi:hypothetical protein|nr:hypothetical protein [Armatimonadota bacterium]
MVAASIVAAVAALGQTSLTPIRVKVYHADPFKVKAMLEGLQVPFPEIQVMFGGMMGGVQMPQVAAPIFPDGRWVVDVTDNALWFFPNKK